MRKEILSTVENGEELSPEEIMNRYVLKKRDEVANYVGSEYERVMNRYKITLFLLFKF